MNRVFKASASFNQAAEKSFLKLADFIARADFIPKNMRDMLEEDAYAISQTFNKKSVFLNRDEIFSLIGEKPTRYLNASEYTLRGIITMTMDMLKVYNDNNVNHAAYRKFLTPLVTLGGIIGDSAAEEAQNNFHVEVPRKTMNNLVRNMDVLHDFVINIVDPDVSASDETMKTAESLIDLHNSLVGSAHSNGIGPYADPEYRDRLDIYLEDEIPAKIGMMTMPTPVGDIWVLKQ